MAGNSLGLLLQLAMLLLQGPQIVFGLPERLLTLLQGSLIPLHLLRKCNPLPFHLLPALRLLAGFPFPTFHLLAQFLLVALQSAHLAFGAGQFLADSGLAVAQLRFAAALLLGMPLGFLKRLPQACRPLQGRCQGRLPLLQFLMGLVLLLQSQR